MKHKQLKRFYVQQMINDCNRIVKDRLNDNKGFITLSKSEKEDFFELSVALKGTLSHYEDVVTIQSLAEDYLKEPSISVRRLFHDKDKLKFHKKMVIRVLQSCENVANEYLGEFDTTLSLN